MKSRILLGPLLLAIPIAARGQAPPLLPDVVDTVEVVAPRPFPEETLAGPRGFVQVIPLDSAAPAGTDLGHLLDRASGVQIRRYGGLGAFSMASIRGCSPAQVQVLINDTPLSTAPDGVSNLSLLPADLFERIEVARGPFAVKQGSGAAGAIRLITKRRFDSPPKVRFGLGSFGMTSLSATVVGRSGPFSVLVSGGRLASEGDYTYLDRGGTPLEPLDDKVVRRLNNSFHQEDLLLQTNWTSAHKVQVETTTHGFWRDAGIPGTESLQAKHVRDSFLRRLQSIAVTSPEGSALGWNVSSHVQEDVDRYRNPEGEVGLGRADIRSRLLAYGVDAGLVRRLPRFDALLRLEGRLLSETWHREDYLSDGSEEPRKRTTREVDLGADLRPWSSRVELLAQQAWLWTQEGYRDSDGEGRESSLRSTHAGISVDIGSAITIRAGWVEFARIPSFVELFGQGGVQVGNDALSAETGTSRDAGLTLRGPNSRIGKGRIRSQIEVVHFQADTDAAIVWLQNSQRSTRPQNLERARVRGMEVVLRNTCELKEVNQSRWLPRIQSTVTYTFQDARDDGPTVTYRGKVLPYQPRDRFTLGIEMEAARVDLTYFLDYESDFYRDRYNSRAQHRGMRVRQNIGSAFRFAQGRAEVGLEIRNLTDTQSEDIYGFPVPGRSYLFQLTLCFRDVSNWGSSDE